MWTTESGRCVQELSHEDQRTSRITVATVDTRAAHCFGAADAWRGPGALAPLLGLAAVLGIVTAGALGVAGRRISATIALPFGSIIAAAFWRRGGEVAWLV